MLLRKEANKIAFLDILDNAKRVQFLKENLT